MAGDESIELIWIFAQIGFFSVFATAAAIIGAVLAGLAFYLPWVAIKKLAAPKPSVMTAADLGIEGGRS